MEGMKADKPGLGSIGGVGRESEQEKRGFCFAHLYSSEQHLKISRSCSGGGGGIL